VKEEGSVSVNGLVGLSDRLGAKVLLSSTVKKAVIELSFTTPRPALSQETEEAHHQYYKKPSRPGTFKPRCLVQNTINSLTNNDEQLLIINLY
jgi:hypothetical protein